MSAAVPVPEGTVAQRPLHFFWIADYSGSMAGKKMATLNQAVREAVPEVRKAVATHPEVAIMMRAIKFADDAAWHVGPNPTAVEQFVWPELSPGGGTSTSQAIRLLAAELTLEKMPRRGYPPVCILVSDGYCTDPPGKYDAAIADLLKLPWAIKAIRLAIAIGDESEYDEGELLKFVSHREIGVLKADTPQKLVGYIKFYSVAASVAASVGKSKAGASGLDTSNVASASRSRDNLQHRNILGDAMADVAECLLVGDAGLGWAVGCSRKGVSHVREGKPCQDAWALWSGAVGGLPCLIAAVADGHGDDRHDLSHLGAAFAVKAAVDELLSLFTHCRLEEGPLAFKRSFKADFPRRVGRRWREAVLADARERPGDVQDQTGDNHRLFVRYGTTLLAALITEDGLLLGQLGDGAVFLVRPDGAVESPFSTETSDVGTVTNSLCSADVPHLWHTAVLERAGGGTLFLATDGLVNAFPNDEETHTFALSLGERIREFGLARVAASLSGWLDHYSAKGSGDDITLTLVSIPPLPCGDPAEKGARQAETKENPSTEEFRHATGDGTTGPSRDSQHHSDREAEAG